MKNEGFDVERELRANRPEPRGDYTRALAGEVRSHEPTRTRAGRVGLALALSGLTVVALASFGGIGYASSSGSHAVKQPTKVKHVRIVNSSAAHAQYAPVTPKKPKHSAAAKPTKVTQKHAAAAAAAVKVQKAPATATTSQLPFTGLALWVPLAIGLMLIAFGLVLRTRGRRGHRGAH